MKAKIVILAVVLISAVFISGCINQTPTGGAAGVAEQIATEQVEQELGIVDNLTADDIENLLTE